MSQTARAIGDTVAGRYVVEQFLGESPCGRSYAASEAFSENRFCLKIYNPAASSMLLKTVNFFLKAGALTEIRHENICVVQDIQEEEGQIYLVRELAEGVNFDAWLATADAETRAKTGVQILWQLGQGLLEIHQSARHLNLHPGNVIVGPLVSRVCDWDPRALAPGEASEPLPTRPSYAGYSAPEVRQGQAGYPSSDIYSLGALAYRLALGDHPPVQAGPLQANLASLDSGLAAFLGKAMAQKPEDRYQHPDHFSEILWNLQANLLDSLTASPRKPVSQGNRTTFTPTQPAHPTPAQPAFGDTLIGGLIGDRAETFRPASDSRDDARVDARDSLARELSRPTEAPPPEDFFRPASIPKTEPAAEKFRMPPPRQPTPPPRSEPVHTHFSSLEIPKATGMGKSDDEVSATLFGFQGLNQGAPRHETPPPEKPKTSSSLWWMIGAMVALLVVTAGIVTYILLLGAEPEIPPARNPRMGQTVPAENRFGDGSEPAQAHSDWEAPPASPPAPQPPSAESTPLPEPAPEYTQTQATQAEPTSRANDIHPGNSKVSSQRATHILKEFRRGVWPPSMSECVRMADDFNDLGKVEEAYAGYSRALEYGENDTRLLIRALGGLAVTSDLLGRKAEAIRALDKILTLDPGNRFARQYRKGLE